MYFNSGYVLLLSCVLLFSPLSASLVDGFKPPDSPDSGENLVEPPSTAYQGGTSGSPQAGTPTSGNIEFSPPPDNVLPGAPQLPYVPAPTPPIDDSTTPSIMPVVPSPTSNAPLPVSPQLPFTITPSPTDNTLPTPPDSSLPTSPQLPFASPPLDSSLPESPQLPFGSSPPLYNTLPGSPHSPLAYHNPKGTEPSTSIAPAPFGVYPSGQNQIQQFGQSNGGLFGQPQGLNDVPIGEYGGCSSTRVDLIATAIALIGVLSISWF